MRGACRGNDNPFQVKDVLSSREARLTWVEEGLSGYNTHLEEVDGHLEGLGSEDAVIHDAMRMIFNQLKKSHTKDLEKLRGSSWLR